MTVDQLASTIQELDRRVTELEATAPAGTRKETAESKDLPKKETGKHDRL